MGIRKWRDRRGRKRVYLSKQWPDGSRFRRVMPNKTVAKGLSGRIDSAVAMGTWRELQKELRSGPTERNPTISQFAKTYLETCKGRNRDFGFKERNVDHIKRILGLLPLLQLRRAHASEFVQKRLGEGAHPSTVNRGLAVLKHMVSLAIDHELLEHHPLLKYRMLPVVQEALRILTYDEYRKLVNCVTEEDPVIGVYTVLLGETGMRKAEGLRLKWTDIHGRIVAIGRAKSGKVRSVPLSEFGLEALTKLVRYIDIPFVFVDAHRRRPWKDPRGPFAKGKERAGLDWVNFHSLRHFRATQWLMMGLDVNTVKELLGHSSIQTTMRYVHYVQSYAMRSILEAQRRELEEWKTKESSTGRKLDDGGVKA